MVNGIHLHLTNNKSIMKKILFYALALLISIQAKSQAIFDAAVTSGLTGEYSQMPLAQASIPLGGVIQNVGTSSLTNVNLSASIFNSSNMLVYSASSAAIPTLASSASSTFNMASYIPIAAGVYTVQYLHTQTESDTELLNDTINITFTITNTQFARDNGVSAGPLGIGAGNGGYLGNSFTLTSPAYLYSIRTIYEAGYTNEPYASLIWNTNALGVPTTVLASTDTSLYIDNNTLDVTQPIVGGIVLLPIGTYVVTAVEFDSTLQLQTSNNIFTAGKIWVNWPTTPFGGWGNVEAFGANFAKPMAIRINVGPTQIPLSSEELKLAGKTSLAGNNLTWTNNENSNEQYRYELERSNDVKTWTKIYATTSIGNGITNTLNYVDLNGKDEKNYYRILVKDIDNKLKYSNVVVLNNTINSLNVDIYPNPAKQHVTVSLNQYQNMSVSILDYTGKILLSQQIKDSNTELSLQNIASGVYTILLSDVKGLVFKDKLIIE